MEHRHLIGGCILEKTDSPSQHLSVINSALPGGGELRVFSSVFLFSLILKIYFKYLNFIDFFCSCLSYFLLF